MTRYWFALLLSIVLSGCVQPGSRIFRDNPELRPGQTTWAEWQAGTARPQNEPLPTNLNALLQSAVERSPRVRAAKQAWIAAIEQVGGAGLPPRPQLIYTALPLPVETRVGPNEHRVALQQKIPSIPALAAQHDAAVAQASALEQAWVKVVLDVVLEVKTLSAEVRYLQQALGLLDASEGLAKQLVAAARTSHEADRATLYDLSKAQAQLAQLGFDRIRFKELLEAAEGRLNAALDADIGRKLPPLGAWPWSPIAPTVEALYEAALLKDPGVKGRDAAIRREMAGVRMAWGALFPDLTVGVTWMVNGEAVMDGVADSGKDALGITVGLSLPLWGGAEKARIGAAEARLDSEVLAKRAHINDLLASIKDEYLRVRNAQRLVQLYDTTLMPEAQRAMEDAEVKRVANAGTFTDLLEARNTLHRYALARERAYADAVMAQARLERLVGGEAIAAKGGQP